MSLQTDISLLVATLDLKQVTSVLNAIHAADAASGKQFPVTAIGPAPNPRLAGGDCYERCDDRRVGNPTPLYKPREVFHPTPAYAPRAVIHPQPRVDELCPPAPPECAKVATHWPEAPWKSLPWKNPSPVPQQIKVTVRVHDKLSRGQIIDLFI